MRMEATELQGLRCAFGYPDGYVEGERYPVLLFLHGAGSRGSDVHRLMKNPFFGIVSKHEDLPFVIVAPLCSGDTWVDHHCQLKSLALELSEASFADPERIYLMGASMGGYETWQLALSIPELFAAIVPICGGGMYAFAEKLVGVPVWAFHGALDDVVYPSESENMVNAVNKHGGSARLTIYPERAHNAWSDTYKDPEVFAWMLSHKRQNAEICKDKLTDSDVYG